MTDQLYERYKDALRRGHVAALRGRLDAAVAAYADAAEIAPDRAMPHASLGGVLRRLGRPDQALAEYGRALDLAPTDDVASLGRAEVLDELGRRVEAAEAYDRRAEILDAAGRLPDAADAALRALDLAESRSRRRVVEVFVSRLRDSADPATAERIEAALGAFDRVAAAGELPPAGPPPDPDALSAEADDDADGGDRNAAVGKLAEAAAAYRGDGRRDAALDACYRALGLDPASTRIHLLLAELWLERGWRTLASEKLDLVGRFDGLDAGPGVRDEVARIGAIAGLATAEPNPPGPG